MSGKKLQATEHASSSNKPNERRQPRPKQRLAALAQIGEDWFYLALLGTIMALLSFFMDAVISLLLSTRLWLFRDLDADSIFVQYLGWSIIPMLLVAFSSGFVHICSPTAIGSGIPEMKTILRGVVLNEYLTFRTLVAKVVGLTFTLGSGLPLGKEGPFVHMASIVATLLSKVIASFQGIYENESRTSEMLSAACAVGVAATFYAPIGGVLFSIEVTTVYFAVRNYWRAFFAACCGATIWRLLGFWVKNDESISALFKTNFRTDYPFDPVELLAFSFIGASCGLGGAFYIKFHRRIVNFFRQHKKVSEFFHKNRFVYPSLITFIITSVTFPPLMGKYMASTLSTHATIEHLFSNKTWSLGNEDLVSKAILDQWTTPWTSFYLHLVLYIAMLFWSSALASTIPIPSGLFIPVLKMGAAYGRLLGELMHWAFPTGISYGPYSHLTTIVPGSYAVVGAAALSGAVTHTISTSVILFEMTGQIVHLIPVILGVLIANAVCQSIEPSIYDSIIEIKKLPYLPPIASSNSVSHKVLVKDFMNTKLAFVWKQHCTYSHIKSLLSEHRKIISFPLVESPRTMKLLGSISRLDLLKLLYLHIGRERRLQEVSRRNSETRTPIFLTKGGSSIDAARQRLTNLEFKLSMTALNNDDSSSASSGSSTSTSGSGESKQIYRGHSDSSFALEKPAKSIVYREVSSEEECELAVRINHCDHNTEERANSSVSKVQKPKTTGDLYVGSENPQALVKSSNSILEQRSGQLKSLKELKPCSSLCFSPTAECSSPQNSRPTKSILKISSANSSFSSLHKRNSSFQSFSGPISVSATASPRVLPRGRLSMMLDSKSDHSEQRQSNGKFDGSESPSASRKHGRKVKLPKLRVIDMTPDEQEQWKKEQLRAYIDVTKCQVDEAPFQLVEQTSLYRVHILFSMLGLDHAYVTSFGRLVGVVALKDIRYAIDKMLEDK